MGSSFRQSLPLLLGLAGAIAVQAQSQLTTVSPFLPSGGAPNAPGENATLEFRGYMVTPADGTLLNIVNATTKKGAWVKLNEGGRDFVVKNFAVVDGRETVSVEYQNRVLQLPLAKPKVASAGAAVPPAPVSIAGNPAAQPAATGPIAPVVLNPTPADEARRLEAFAAEVRRRRQLREQSDAAPAGAAQAQSPDALQRQRGAVGPRNQ